MKVGRKSVMHHIHNDSVRTQKTSLSLCLSVRPSLVYTVRSVTCNCVLLCLKSALVRSLSVSPHGTNQHSFTCQRKQQGEAGGTELGCIIE